MGEPSYLATTTAGTHNSHQKARFCDLGVVKCAWGTSRCSQIDWSRQLCRCNLRRGTGNSRSDRDRTAWRDIARDRTLRRDRTFRDRTFRRRYWFCPQIPVTKLALSELPIKELFLLHLSPMSTEEEVTTPNFRQYLSDDEDPDTYDDPTLMELKHLRHVPTTQEHVYKPQCPKTRETTHCPKTSCSGRRPVWPWILEVIGCSTTELLYQDGLTLDSPTKYGRRGRGQLLFYWGQFLNIILKAKILYICISVLSTPTRHRRGEVVEQA